MTLANVIADAQDPPKGYKWKADCVYVAQTLRPPTWWERGLVRYCVLSYSLWTRTLTKAAWKHWRSGR